MYGANPHLIFRVLSPACAEGLGPDPPSHSAMKVTLTGLPPDKPRVVLHLFVNYHLCS